MSAVAYISIGNSDDKLTQAKWSAYVGNVGFVVLRASELPGGALHGFWLSETSSQWQNACWALQLPTNAASVEHIKYRLAEVAGQFDQDSVAWALAPETEFIPGAGIRDSDPPRVSAEERSDDTSDLGGSE